MSDYLEACAAELARLNPQSSILEQWRNERRRKTRERWLERRRARSDGTPGDRAEVQPMRS